MPPRDRRRAVDAIVEALAEHGPLTRAALMEHVERAGVATDGQKAAHLPRLAAIEGRVCFGAPQGSKPTYALWRDWLGAEPEPLPRERALAELARRYVRAYAPADVRDFATWSGLGAAEARAGWEAAGSHEPPEPAEPSGLVRMLPVFDTYLLGYRTRDHAVPPEHSRQVWPGGGIVRPTVIEDGRAVATWRLRRSGTRVAIDVEPFGREPATAHEIGDIRRFSGSV